MEEFNPKEESKGLGDTIAKFTHATGLNKVATNVAKLAGKDDCGCGKRQKTLNDLFPYTKPSTSISRHTKIQPPLETIEGEYELLQPIHLTHPEHGPRQLNKGMILTIDKNHPMYNDIPHFYKNNIIKKL